MKKTSSVKTFSTCKAMGIDVSSADLAVVGIAGDQSFNRTLVNRMKPMKPFFEGLVKHGFSGKIICESTGHYHLKLAIICHGLGLNLIVINPLQSSKHSKARIRKTKTDPVDAHTLATMCVTEQALPKPAQLTRAKVLIQLKRGQLASLEKLLQKANQSVKQYEQTYEGLGLDLSEFQRSLADQVSELRRLRKKMEKEFEGLLVKSMPDDGSIEGLRKIPGFSEAVAGLVGNFDRQVPGPQSWVAFVGFDVSVRESGTWKGKGRLTKRGNAYLRKRLYQAAWGACLSYDYVRAYYDQLKAEGRSHVAAVCMLARKLLRIAYQVAVNKVEYNHEIAFSQ